MDKFDIHFQLSETEGMRPFSFGFKSAIGVRGPQKLVNRWLKCFMTTKGTDLLNRNYGTGFSSLIGSNVTRVQDIIDALTLYIEDCNEQMFALDRLNFPPENERLSSASLTLVKPRNEDGFDAWIELRNTAGEVLSVQLPSIARR